MLLSHVLGTLHWASLNTMTLSFFMLIEWEINVVVTKCLWGCEFCSGCPIGTYKDVEGSNPSMCHPCPLEILPNRASFIYVRGNTGDCVVTPEMEFLSLTFSYFFWD